MNFKNLIICFFTIYHLPLFGQSLIPSDAGSKVHFVIRNFGIKVGGDFSGLKGAIYFDPTALNKCQFSVSVDAKTIDTDNNARDKHLRAADYFNTDKYPEVNFTSTQITPSTIAGRYFVIGKLTLKGISKEVQFGFSAIPINNGYKFNGQFEINRRDFGIGSSSLILSDNLTVSLNVLAVK